MSTSRDPEDDVSDNFNMYGGGTCSPGGRCYRYLALGFMCLLGFGSYFCFDNPGALQDVITKDMDLTTTQFSYLYSSYSMPNIVLCFVGGFLIDRVFGIKFGTVLYALIVFFGQLVVATGSILDSFWLMIMGRVIFGIGGESLAVAQNYYAVMWFKDRELNMVMGLQLSLARVGSALNFLVMDHLYHVVQEYFKGREGLGITLFIASIACLASFISALCLCCMQNKKQESESQSTEKKEEVVKLTDIKDFPLSFWLTAVICVAYYVAIFPFIALAKVFFMRKFGLTSVEANAVNSLLYTLSAIISPFLGFLIDKTGWNLLWLSIAIIISVGGHLLLAFTFLYPLYAMIVLGTGYSLCAASLWPMIALIIPEYQLGTAYGVAQAFQNGGLALATLIAGMIVDYGGYLMLEIFFLSSLFVALIACLGMWVYDISTTGILNMTCSQRNAMKTNSLDSQLLYDPTIQGTSADISPYDVTLPQNDAQIRNRYLAKVGATEVPEHLDPLATQVFRTLR